MFNLKKKDAVADAVAKILAESELSDKQKKIAKLAGDKDKIDAADLASLRAGKKPVEEGFDDMEKYLKNKDKPQPSGGAGKKQGSKYGGSKQKEEEPKEDMKEDTEQVDEVMHVFHATSPGAKMQRFHKDSPDPQAAAHRNATAAAVKGLRASGSMNRKSIQHGSSDDIKTSKGGTVMAMKREEIEELDELSNKTLDSYKGKAYQDYRKQVKDSGSGDVAKNRVVGIARAQQKRSMKSEDIEEMDEKAPPGFEGTVKAMKKHKEIDNPFALAWYMKNKGDKSHKKADGSMKKEEVELDEEKPVVIKTNKPIGTRVADIGPGGKEHNVKTDKEWDKQKGEKVKEDVNSSPRTKDMISGRKPTKQTDDVGPGSDSKSTKVKLSVESFLSMLKKK